VNHSQTIELIVSPKGETKLVTKGFAGSRCQDASRFLEQALGRVLRDKKTTTYYQCRAAGQQLNERS